MQNLAPLAGPRVAEAARSVLLEMFGVWARALSSAFAKYTTADGSLPARLGARPLPRNSLEPAVLWRVRSQHGQLGPCALLDPARSQHEKRYS